MRPLPIYMGRRAKRRGFGTRSEREIQRRRRSLKRPALQPRGELNPDQCK